MKITVKTTAAAGLSETKAFLVTPGSPLKMPALANSKVELFFDGVKQTGSELVNGKRVLIKKVNQDLVLSLDGEDLTVIEDFYEAQGASLDGAGWSFTGADGLAIQEGALVATPGTGAEAATAVLVGAGLGGAGVLGAAGLVAIAASGGGGSGGISAQTAALAKIEGYNNGDGTNTPIPTVQDYVDAGVTGVNADNLAAINAQVLKQNPGGADTAAKLQALAAAANAALAKIEAYNNGDGITPPPLTEADYAAAGITGVSADNVIAVNAQVLKQIPGGANGAPEVQALANIAVAAIQKLENYNNGNGVTPSAPTPADYEAAGVTGVTTDNVAAVNAQVLKQATNGANTPAKVQVLVNVANTAIAKIEDYNNGNGTTPPALTLTDYAEAGIAGVIADNLAVINAKVLALPAGGADSAPEVQALVTAANNALDKIEDYNNGNGITPPALTPADYAAAGITGVTPNNVAAINAQVLKQASGGANSIAEVQPLVAAADAAIAKIENYNNGNGTTPAALTLADYAEAGIAGVTADNLAALNAKILALSPGGADTAPDIQGVVAALNSALDKIERYNNGNGTMPAALTVADYVAAGITGVTTDNLAAVNAQVLKQLPGGANSIAEVQPLVGAADAALQKIEDYNNGNGITPPPLLPSDYAAAGIAGVTADNVNAVNGKVLALPLGGADAAPDVQTVVDAITAGIAKIEAYNNGNGTTPPALTLTDYSDAGITGVTADNLAAVNAQVLKQAATGADTPAQVQALVLLANTAIAKIEGYNNGNGTTPSAPSVTDYADAGVSGVTADNLAAVNAQVLAQAPGGASTDPLVQALVTSANAALAKIEAYNNGNGTTPAALVVADYVAAGVVGVTVDNVAAVNVQVLNQSAGGANTGPKIQSLVAPANAAIQKIEDYNNGNGSLPPALTVADYANAGVKNVTSSNLTAVNAKILALAVGGADSVPEIQAQVISAADALQHIEDYNNGDGTVPPALIVPDYVAAGVTGVTPENLAAVNAQVLKQSPGGADTLVKVQNLVSVAQAAIQKIEDYNNGNGVTPVALTEADYAEAGITGVTAENVIAVNAKVLALAPGGADSTTEVQTVISTMATAIAKIEAYNNGNGTTPSAPSVADYFDAGITGVTDNNVAAVNAQVLQRSPGGADTPAEVQPLVALAIAALQKIEDFNNGNGITPAPLTVADYAAAGITGVTADNLSAMNAQVLAQIPGGAATHPLLQQLVNAANAAIQKIEDFNNGNGITPAALTVTDYAAAGITGVTTDNVVAVNVQVLKQSPGGANTDPKIQALVAGLNNAIDQLELFAQNNTTGLANATGTVPDLGSYANAGLTGVNAANLNAINDALASAAVDGSKADTSAEVQAIVTAYNAILASADGTAGNTSTPLSTAQYTDIGVTAAPTGSGLGLLDNVIDGKASTAVDGVSEVQALADAAKAVMTGAAAGVAPTLDQLALLGVTGVTAQNLVAVQEAINATPDSGTGVDTLAKLQAVANVGQTAAVDALLAIQTAAQNNTASTSTPALATYVTAGVTGVTAANLAAVNSALNSAAVDGSKADTSAEVQAIVTAYNAILASADGTAGNTTTPLTGDQYAAVGVMGVSGGAAPAAGSALYLLNDVVDLSASTAVGTEVALQNMADAAAHVMSGVAGGIAPTLLDFGYLGITGVNATNLATAQAAIDNATASGVDTRTELQGVITAALASPSMTSSLGGVTNLDVTSNLVFNVDQTVVVGQGNIRITDLEAASGGTGYRSDTHTNDQVIDVATAVSQGLLQISGTGANTKIIINPLWDLDLSSNYEISIDAGAFRSASGNNASVAVGPIQFSTVTPGMHANGGLAATEAVASRIMADDGTLVASKSWLDIESIGDIQQSMTQLGDLSGGSYALVMKNYATAPGGAAPGGDGSDGITAHSTNVGVVNFGNNDVLYFDSQVNNLAVQKFDAGYSVVGDLHAVPAGGGLVGQSGLQLGVSAGQAGGQAYVALGLEGNSSNTYYNAIYTLGPDIGFANVWHNQSPPVLMG